MAAVKDGQDFNQRFR